MSLLFQKMKEELNQQTNTITENITKSVLAKVDDKIKPIIEENKKLKSELEVLNKKIENLELKGKRNNVIIHGIPEMQHETHEDLKALVMSTLKEIDVSLKEEEINRMQRLGKNNKDDSKIRPIMLSTTTLQKKVQILKSKNKMKSNAYITQDLSKAEILKRKENRNKNKNETDTRKRKERSGTPSPKGNIDGKNNEPKARKRDAFQYLRERSYSLSDKYSYRNEDAGTTSQTSTTNQ